MVNLHKTEMKSIPPVSSYKQKDAVFRIKGLNAPWMEVVHLGIRKEIPRYYEFASGDYKFLEGGNREDSQELYVIFAKDLEKDSASQLFLQVGVELQKDGRQSMSIDLDEDEEDEDHDMGDDDDDSRHDPNVWFANIGGYMTWEEAVLSLELNLSEEQQGLPLLEHQYMDLLQ